MKVVATEDGTTVRFGQDTPITLNTGQHTEKAFGQTDWVDIGTNKPVLAAQFVAGSTATSGGHDPAMLVMTAADQWRPQYTFSTVRTDGDDFIHCVMVVIEQTKLARLQLDKSIVSQSGWIVFPGVLPVTVGKAITISPGTYFHIFYRSE